MIAVNVGSGVSHVNTAGRDASYLNNFACVMMKWIKMVKIMRKERIHSIVCI